MPINSFIKIATTIVIGVAISGGSQNLNENLLALKYKMMKELVRTDNWGNPSIFGANTYSTIENSVFALKANKKAKPKQLLKKKIE